MRYTAERDRSYWRMAKEKELIEAARDSGHELAIALGERLEDLSIELDMLDKG
jgi:hypothetical protein